MVIDEWTDNSGNPADTTTGKPSSKFRVLFEESVQQRNAEQEKEFQKILMRRIYGKMNLDLEKPELKLDLENKIRDDARKIYEKPVSHPEEPEEEKPHFKLRDDEMFPPVATMPLDGNAGRGGTPAAMPGKQAVSENGYAASGSGISGIGAAYEGAMHVMGGNGRELPPPPAIAPIRLPAVPPPFPLISRRRKWNSWFVGTAGVILACNFFMAVALLLPIEAMDGLWYTGRRLALVLSILGIFFSALWYRTGKHDEMPGVVYQAGKYVSVFARLLAGSLLVMLLSGNVPEWGDLFGPEANCRDMILNECTDFFKSNLTMAVTGDRRCLKEGDRVWFPSPLVWYIDQSPERKPGSAACLEPLVKRVYGEAQKTYVIAWSMEEPKVNFVNRLSGKRSVGGKIAGVFYPYECHVRMTGIVTRYTLEVPVSLSRVVECYVSALESGDGKDDAFACMRFLKSVKQPLLLFSRISEWALHAGLAGEGSAVCLKSEKGTVSANMLYVRSRYSDKWKLDSSSVETNLFFFDANSSEASVLAWDKEVCQEALDKTDGTDLPVLELDAWKRKAEEAGLVSSNLKLLGANLKKYDGAWKSGGEAEALPLPASGPDWLTTAAWNICQSYASGLVFDGDAWIKRSLLLQNLADAAAKAERDKKQKNIKAQQNPPRPAGLPEGIIY